MNSLCMVAIKYLHSTIDDVLHAPGILQSHIRLLQPALDTSHSVSQAAYLYIPICPHIYHRAHLCHTLSENCQFSGWGVMKLDV